jgi:hypothetical protein
LAFLAAPEIKCTSRYVDAAADAHGRHKASKQTQKNVYFAFASISFFLSSFIPGLTDHSGTAFHFANSRHCIKQLERKLEPKNKKRHG